MTVRGPRDLSVSPTPQDLTPYQRFHQIAVGKDGQRSPSETAPQARLFEFLERNRPWLESVLEEAGGLMTEFEGNDRMDEISGILIWLLSEGLEEKVLFKFFRVLVREPDRGRRLSATATLLLREFGDRSARSEPRRSASRHARFDVALCPDERSERTESSESLAGRWADHIDELAAKFECVPEWRPAVEPLKVRSTSKRPGLSHVKAAATGKKPRAACLHFKRLAAKLRRYLERGPDASL